MAHGDQQTITRAEFIRRYVAAGLTYDQAKTAFDTMISVVEDAIISGSIIKLGRVGSLVPQWREPRQVTMGFQRLKGNKIEKTKRVYFLGRRVRYNFHLYRSFFNAKFQELKW